MIRSHWKSNVGTVCAAFALLLFSGACSGSSDGGVPTAPPTVVEIAGHWTGSTANDSVSGCGCVAQEFTSGPHRRPTEWEISQSGAAIEGIFYDDLGPGWCEFTGTVEVNDFSVASTHCEQEEMQWECENGSSRDLVLRSIDWHGKVLLGTRQINGTSVTTWDCFNSRDGQAIGALTLQSSLRLNQGAPEDHAISPRE